MESINNFLNFRFDERCYERAATNFQAFTYFTNLRSFSFTTADYERMKRNFATRSKFTGTRKISKVDSRPNGGREQVKGTTLRNMVAF